MEIPVTIDKHCIETEAGRHYEKLLGRYFRKTVSDREKLIVERQIEPVDGLVKNKYYEPVKTDQARKRFFDKTNYP